MKLVVASKNGASCWQSGQKEMNEIILVNSGESLRKNENVRRVLATGRRLGAIVGNNIV